MEKINVRGSLMGEAWHEGLPDDAFKTETDKAYERASGKIRENLEKGQDFETACSGMGVDDESLRKAIAEDMLKVLIAEEHFGKGIPLDELAAKLKVGLERLETAKLAMLEDVKNTSIKAFYKSLGHGNA